MRSSTRLAACLGALAACGPSFPGVQVRLEPTAPTAADTITAVVTTDGDDGDGMDFVWTVAGAPVEGDATLEPGPFARGDSIAVTVTPVRDGKRGDPVTSGAVTVVNAAPIVDAVTLSPPTPISTDTLTAEPVGSDVDADDLTWTYTWFVDGNEAGLGPTLAPPNPRGTSIEVEVVASDGSAVSPPVRSSIVVTGNAPPPAVTPTLEADADWIPIGLTCTVPTVVDPDGDAVTYEMEWVVDGVGRGVSEESTLRVETEETSAGGVWSCRARAVDDQGDGSVWTTSEDSIDQTCDPQTVTVHGLYSASLAYNSGTSWNDETLRAYTYGSSGGIDDVVGWVVFDLSSIEPLVSGVADATLDLYCNASFSSPRIVVVQSASTIWDPDDPDPSTLTRDGEISDVTGSLVTSTRNRFPLDLGAWTHGPARGVEAVTIGVDNLRTTYSYGYFGSTEASGYEPSLELTVCQ